MKNLLLLLTSLVPLSHAFHEPVVKMNSVSQRRRLSTTLPTSHTIRQSSSSALPQSDTTALFASRQFRNVDDMLDSLREDLVLLNFVAVNCGPCQLQKKELASVSQTFVGEDDLQMLAIDTNRWPSVSSRFQVGKLPCLVALRDGQVLFRLEGYVKAEEVVARVRSVRQQQPQQHRY